MPANVIWDDEARTVVRYVMQGQWEWAEFRPIVDEARAMITSQTHPVGIIADLRESGPLPGEAIPTLKYMAEITPDNACAFVVVGGSRFVRAIGGIFRRIYPRLGLTPQFADTLEEARALIAEAREQHR